jgi:hypothetical protein
VVRWSLPLSLDSTDHCHFLSPGSKGQCLLQVVLSETSAIVRAFGLAKAIAAGIPMGRWQHL